MSLRSVNLNLLPILQALQRERNLSLAAKAVGLTQPAISAALAKLRLVLDDPLLVREGRGMALTPRAIDLIGPVNEICESIEKVIASAPFDPGQTTHSFVIASGDPTALVIAPVLLRLMEQLAPNAAIHIVDIPYPSLEKHTSEVDLFIVPEVLFHDGAHPTMRRQTLIEDEYVTIVAADHRLALIESPTADDMLAERYAIYYPALSRLDPASLSAFTGCAEQQRQIVAQIQQISLLPTLVLETGCAAIMPRIVANYILQSQPIKIIEEPTPPIHLTLTLAWHSSKETDPAQRWFRKLVIEHCTQLRA